MNTSLIKKLLLIPLIVLIDQLSKQFIFRLLTASNEPITVIKNVLSFSLVLNDGVAFGVFSQKPFLILGITSAAILLMLFYLIKNHKNLHKLEISSWCLVLGGAVGNLLDRIFLGYVIDFIKLDFINFPVFNISDIAINIGVISLIILLFKNSPKNR